MLTIFTGCVRLYILVKCEITHFPVAQKFQFFVPIRLCISHIKCAYASWSVQCYQCWRSGPKTSVSSLFSSIYKSGHVNNTKMPCCWHKTWNSIVTLLHSKYTGLINTERQAIRHNFMFSCHMVDPIDKFYSVLVSVSCPKALFHLESDNLFVSP